MPGVVQAQFARHALDGAGQPLAEGLRAAAPLGRDLGPVAARGPLVGQVPFVLRESVAELPQQLVRGRLLARAGVSGGDLADVLDAGRGPAIVAPRRRLLAG